MSNGRVVPFNPLNKRNLAESVARALLRQPARSMSQLERFKGAGIYVIYYTGDFPPYGEIATRNANGRFAAPIYVGSKTPSGSRKGNIGLDVEPGYDLHGRLKKHRESLMAANNLNIEDFYYRLLVVEDIWIPLGESLLITQFTPIWNRLVDGFGNHDPGRGRYGGLRPRWDVLHPGRAWAEKCKPREETQEQLTREVREFLANNPPPDDANILSD